MRIVKNTLKGLIALFIVFSVFAFVSGKTYLFKAVVYNFANIDDYKIFENNTVQVAQAQPWSMSAAYNKINYPDSLNALMEELDAVGLLMIKNDSIQFEKYWDGYSDSSLSNSFSMAKSVSSLLIGVAIKEGKIQSVEQPVDDYSRVQRRSQSCFKNQARINHE
jgi:hypothetical protein